LAPGGFFLCRGVTGRRHWAKRLETRHPRSASCAVCALQCAAIRKQAIITTRPRRCVEVGALQAPASLRHQTDAHYMQFMMAFRIGIASAWTWWTRLTTSHSEERRQTAQRTTSRERFHHTESMLQCCSLWRAPFFACASPRQPRTIDLCVGGRGYRRAACAAQHAIRVLVTRRTSPLPVPRTPINWSYW
jgi:hypothetical protein